jgi:hypothetical protein
MADAGICEAEAPLEPHTLGSSNGVGYKTLVNVTNSCPMH